MHGYYYDLIQALNGEHLSDLRSQQSRALKKFCPQYPLQDLRIVIAHKSAINPIETAGLEMIFKYHISLLPQIVEFRCKWSILQVIKTLLRVILICRGTVWLRKTSKKQFLILLRS